MQKKWRKTEKTTKVKGKAMLNFVNIAFLRGNKSRHVRKSMRKIMCRKQSHYVLWANAETITPFYCSENYAFLIWEVVWLLYISFRQKIPRTSNPLIPVRFLSLYALYVHSFILSKSSNPPENIPVPTTRCLHLRVNIDDVVCRCSLYFHRSLLLSNLKRQQGVAAANSAGDVHAFHVLVQ